MDLGPLQGIPYGLKDLISVEGYRTTWGAPAYMDQMLDTDAYVYKRYALWRFPGHPESYSGHALQKLLTAVEAKAILAHTGPDGEEKS